MRRVAIVAALILLAAIGWTIATTSPPALLSFLDGMAGGGRGTRRMGEGVPFGAHGQRLDVWRPGLVSRTLRPVVVFWHGGGWVGGTRQAYAFAARAYASQGFVVVVPDYRKVPDVRFPAFLQDGAEAVKWVRDHIADYGGDPDRVALAGHSAGAYTVAMLALDPRWLEAVGVDPHIVKAAVGLSGPYDFYPFDTKRSIDAFAGTAEPALTQPVTFVREDAPPMLLVTSDKDTTVRPRNAERLADGLRRARARVVLKSYPGLDHEDVAMALSKPFRSKAPVLVDSATFLRAALGRSTKLAETIAH